MSEKRVGPLRRTLRFFWNLITRTRRALANLLFLVIVAVIVMALLEEEGAVIADRSVLLLAPSGQVVEQRSVIDPLARLLDPKALKAETSLRDMIDAVDMASEDDRIVGILLNLDELIGIDISSARELGGALTRFRKNGKTVIARGDSYDQGRYLLASYADEIYLHTMGMVGIQGFGVYPAYLKELLDRLQVDIHVFRVGRYKSAVEPFLRNDMSAEARRNNLRWLQSLWGNYTAMVAENRELTPADLEQYVNQFDVVLQKAGGDTAQAALDAGLVDQVLSREEMRQRFKEQAELDDLDEQVVHFRDYLDSAVAGDAEPGGGNKISVVVAEGVIVDGDQPAGVVGGDSVAALLREAREDEDVKAVVLRIDSAGGSAFASEVIREQVKLLQEEGKPVVASMGGVAASGGYWIATGADEIWAQPTTITGSIGIFGVFPSVYRTLAEWGVHTDGVGTTRLADAFRTDRPMNDISERALQSMIEQGYQRFIGLVAQSRGMSIAAVDAVAQGQVWSGEDAQKQGLVDHLGGLQEAIDAVADLAELDDYQVIRTADDGWLNSGLWERFWGVLGERLSAQLLHDLQSRFGFLQLAHSLPQVPVLNDPAGIYLHCLECELR